MLFIAIYALPIASSTIRFTLGTVALAKAYISFDVAFAPFFSWHFVALNPLTLVNVSIGISKASQNSTKSAAFSQPLAVSFASYSAVTFISSSYDLVLLATAPTVAPFNLIKAVTISGA